MTSAPVCTAVLSHHSPSSQSPVPPENHSVVSIPAGVSELYDGILHYASVCPHPESSSSSSRPLFINPNKPFRPSNEDNDNEGSRLVKSLTAAARHGANRLSGMGSVHIEPGTGFRRAQAPTPRIIMDLGNTAVTWPPPKNLLPNFLKTEMEGKNPYCFPDSTEEERMFYVTHYELGEPQLSWRSGELKSMRWVRVTTAYGEQALQHFLHSVLQWVTDLANPDHGGKRFNLYRFKTDCGRGEWMEETSRRARSAESVVLADGQMDDILEDVEQFLKPETRHWYAEHGLPARRSYLFEGLPGTGKTSTIRVIAGKFGLTCCFLSMTNDKFSNQLLGDALSQIPNNALLVLEDVDALFKEDRSSQNSSSLTFSGLLNALDGVTSVDGLITVMTTNHADRLHPALIRGGRVDRQFHFDIPTREQYGILFKLFYKEAERDLVKKFVQGIIEHENVSTPPTIATLQQLFIRYRGKRAGECVAGLKMFLVECAERERASPVEQANTTEQANGS